MRRKIFLLILILSILSVSVLSGCKDNNDKAEKSTDEIDIAYYAYNSEPILNWDPSQMSSNGVIVLNNIYETLLRFNPQRKEFEYLLAESYEKSEDALTWTFKIRKGVKFHDGTDLTAEAVRFSINRTMELGKGFAYIWKEVKEINVIDDYTVEFKLKSPAPLDIIASCAYGAFIMSPTAVENNGDDWFSQGNDAGTGPYMVQSSKMGNEVILTKFDDYWQGWEGKHFDKVVIKKVSETSSRRQMVEVGKADFISDLPAEDINAFKENENVKVLEVPSVTNLLGFLNTKKAPLDNAIVRKALSYAFPYEEVVKYTIDGYAEQSRGVVPKGLWGRSDDLFQYSHDLDKAKSLLKEAGIKEGELTLLYTYNSGNESQKKAGELYKAELSKLGIELEIRAMPWESQWEMAKASDPNDRQDIFVMYGWPIIAHPHTWLFSNFYSEDTILFNLGYYYNKNLDPLIDKAYQTSAFDIKAAEKEILEIQKKIIEDSPALLIYDEHLVWILNSSIKGFEYNPAYSRVVFFYDCYRE